MVVRYALKDLWESEREYVHDLSSVVDTYYSAFNVADLPESLAGKRHDVFSTFPDICRFHHESVLADTCDERESRCLVLYTL